MKTRFRCAPVKYPHWQKPLNRFTWNATPVSRPLMKGEVKHVVISMCAGLMNVLSPKLIVTYRSKECRKQFFCWSWSRQKEQESLPLTFLEYFSSHDEHDSRYKRDKKLKDRLFHSTCIFPTLMMNDSTKLAYYRAGKCGKKGSVQALRYHVAIYCDQHTTVVAHLVPVGKWVGTRAHLPPESL